MTLEVLDPGLLTTVQDQGRPDWTHLGVPVGGACDSWSLAVANLLAGNEPGAAALEMTIVGPTLAVQRDTLIAIGGADLGGVVRETGARIETGRTHRLAAGSTIAFPGDVATSAGSRAYLAVAGGIDVPAVLGSRSTALGAGFGGFEGRPLRAGDELRSSGVGGPERAATAIRAWPAGGDGPLGQSNRAIRVVRGPAAAGGAFEAFVAGTWLVGAGSDRVGVRLDGPRIEVGPYGSVLSHGVTFGTVQLPPDGSPIALLADHQTTGGYPVIAVVISADHPRLGQVRLGAEVRFEEVSLAEARAALVRQRASLDRGTTILREAAGWDDQWQAAGG